MTHTEPANPELRAEEEIRTRCDAATPGPWYRIYDRVITAGYDEEADPADYPAMQRRCTVAKTHPFEMRISRDAQHIADAQFIAAARTDVPALLAALAAARSENEQLEAQVRQRDEAIHRMQYEHNQEVEREKSYAREMERQRNAFGEALTKAANGESAVAAAADAMAALAEPADVAAARSDADQLRTENERLTAGASTDPGDPAAWPLPGQWIRRFLDADADRRLAIAAAMVENSQDAERCHREFHREKIADLAAAPVEVDRLRDEFDRYRAEAMDFARHADENEGQRQRADRLAVEVDALRAKIEAVIAAARDWKTCGEHTGIASNRCMLPPDHRGRHDCQIVPGDATYLDELLAGAVPGSPPEPATTADELVREAIARGEGHALSEAMRCSVVPGSPETRQEEQR